MEELESVQLSGAELDQLRDGARHSADYEILSRHVRLAGNAPEIIERFDILYKPFRREFPAGHAVDTEIAYHVDGRGVFTTFSGSEAYRTEYPEVLKWPSVILNRLILGAVHSHYLVHAGCVARGGRAVVIAGASGMGKTTLVAHLAARSFDFLSDEFAPICRSDGHVEPYPMRLGLRPGPGHVLLGDKESIDLSFRRDAKKLTDIETLAGRKPAKRSALHAVIFFTTDLTPQVTTAQKRGDRMKAWFTVWSDALATELTGTLGASILDQRPDDDMFEVTMNLRDLPTAVESMRAIARRHGGLLAQIQFEDLGVMDRSVTPKLMSIPASAGVIELIKKVPAFSRSALIQHVFEGRAASMVMDVSAVVKNAAFYKLTPGRLDESIALVENLLP